MCRRRSRANFWNGSDCYRSLGMPRTSADGAIAASRMVANNLCFQAVATVTSVADIRRIAAVHNADNVPRPRFRMRVS